MHKISKLIVLIACTITIANNSFCVDNPHFYKAPYMNATKSWKNKDWLSIFDSHYAYGSTRRARNGGTNRVHAFELYGSHNLLYATAGVPQPTNMLTALKSYVDDLDTQRANFEATNPAPDNSFGCVEFCGSCKVDEFIFNYRQNIIYSFFAELNIPVRRVRTSRLCIVDKSPASSEENIPYTQTDEIWLNFLNNFDAILQSYGFCSYQCGSSNSGFGDISLLLGWQHTIADPTDFLEYIKIAAKGGVLFPTGKQRKFLQPFSIETGYNKHLAVPVRFDAIFGLSPDIYFGTYLGFIFFTSKTHCNYPVKTDPKQSGFIKLYRAKVSEKKGCLFDFGTYLTLDHFFKGLSANIGYSYNHRKDDSLSIVGDCSYTNNAIVNGDCRLKNWYMHVLHISTQYDLGVHDCFKDCCWQPRVGLFYDHPFGGKRVITNDMIGGLIGCDVEWNW